MFKAISWLFASMAITSAVGCASAYNSYSDCGVPCQYCEPASLPYTQYDECLCHSQPASRYLATTAYAVSSPAIPAPVVPFSVVEPAADPLPPNNVN